MSAVPHANRVRRGETADPHVVELGKLMLARAPRLGAAMADLLCREIDAYRDGTVVTKDEVADSCVANLTFIFDSLTGNDEVDVSPAEHTGTRRALAGVPLPAVMTAYRIGFRFMWEKTLATARAAAIPTDSILDATARVFFAQDTFTQAMASAYRQQLTAQILEQEEERSALVEALLSRRITDRQSLWEAADLLRLPTSGPYVVVAAELPAIGKLGLPTIENKLSVRDIRSAWRLLPDLQVGIVYLRGPATAGTLGTLVEVLRQAATGRVGISPPFDELGETSDALRFARLAVAGRPSADSLIAVFDDTPLAVAAVSAPEVMAKIKSSVLGRLDELPAEERSILLDTFQAWLDAGGSANDAAAKVYCHPNTVRHRLHRIEELTGRSLARPKDVAELCLAFEVERRLP
jgi:PucR C-terminal helix-turn-helix domain/GGDEF-like domain